MEERSTEAEERSKGLLSNYSMLKAGRVSTLFVNQPPVQGRIQTGFAGLVKPVKFHKTHFLGWCKTLGIHHHSSSCTNSFFQSVIIHGVPVYRSPYDAKQPMLRCR